MQINTVNEQDAYDKGFADGKDYWVPQEHERLLKILKIIRQNCDKYYEEDYLPGLDYAIDILNDVEGWAEELEINLTEGEEK